MSQRFKILILGLLFTAINLHAHPGVHLVWDIDGSLVDNADHLPPDTPGVINLGRHSYLPSFGAQWVLAELDAHPLVKSNSFYSGGDEPRNLALLDLIRSGDESGRSLLKLATAVFSRHHLVLPGAPPGTEITREHMVGREAKKDLTIAHANLENVILIDDWHDFTPEIQRSNILALGPAYTPFASYADAQKWLYDNYPVEGYQRLVPPSQKEWVRHRYKLIRAYNIIIESLDVLADEHNQKSFRELVAEKTAQPNLHHVRRGLKKFRARIRPSCRDLMAQVGPP